MEKYNIGDIIGYGATGMVYEATHKRTKKKVVVKEMPVLDEGVPSFAIREVSLLKEMEHSNIIRLLDVFTIANTVYLVFERMDMDMRKYMRDHPEISKHPSTIKSFLQQILRGVEYCHSHKVLHRDLKPDNLLVNVDTRNVKLGDFGLAKAFGVPVAAHTRDVMTLWYKAPEILLNARNYSAPIDMWSVGCIFAEMVNQEPLFPGKSDGDQISKIFGLLGKPTENTWPEVTSFCGFLSNFIESDPKKMLCLNPKSRITARDALEHAYFYNVGLER